MTTSYWHPFADMGAVSRAELLIERGEGVHVFDADGTRYLDAHGEPLVREPRPRPRDVTRAVDRADGPARRLLRRSATSRTRPSNELAARLAALAPMDDAKVFLASGGGDAIDTAAKIARRHWVLQGRPERVHIISRTNGYHGTHGFGTSIGGIEANTANWGPLVPHTSAVAFDSLPALEQEILRVGPERVAAFFCEPVIGAGGVHPPPEGYIEGVADLCAEHGILLVIDSVICAFGRLGTWFGIERWPEVRPDMITFAKGVTSGYLPLGGVVVSGRGGRAVLRRARAAPMLRHGATYAGHPTCCAAALAVLDAYEAEDLIGAAASSRARCTTRSRRSPSTPRSARSGPASACSAPSSSPEDALAADPGAVAKVAAGARAAGVLVRPLLRGVAVSPPLIVERVAPRGDRVRDPRGARAALVSCRVAGSSA